MENRPLLHVFTTCWNNCLELQEFVTFYREKVPNCLITVYDNMSDDMNITQFCKECDVELIPFDTGGKMDEKTLIEIRNNCWKESKARFIIVCDSDEWVDVSDVDLEIAEMNEEWTVCKTVGYEMYSDVEFYKDAVMGLQTEGYSKKVLFVKDAIKTMNFQAGSHQANPIANEGYSIKYAENPPKLYHMKWASWTRGVARQNQLKNKGVSQDSKSKGWNSHYSFPDNMHKNYWEHGVSKSSKIR